MIFYHPLRHSFPLPFIIIRSYRNRLEKRIVSFRDISSNISENRIFTNESNRNRSSSREEKILSKEVFSRVVFFFVVQGQRNVSNYAQRRNTRVYTIGVTVCTRPCGYTARSGQIIEI